VELQHTVCAVAVLDQRVAAWCPIAPSSMYMLQCVAVSLSGVAADCVCCCSVCVSVLLHVTPADNSSCNMWSIYI